MDNFTCEAVCWLDCFPIFGVITFVIPTLSIEFMEHRIKRDQALDILVTEFEVNFQRGNFKYLDVKSFSQLIDYYENENKYLRAIDVAKLALKQFKYRAEFYITISHLLLKIEDPEQCLTYLAKAESIAPYENEIIILKARAYTANRQYKEALDALESAGAYASIEDQVEIGICESLIHEEVKNYDEMFQCLIDTLALDHHNQEALERLWTATELSKNYIKSIDFHNSLINIDPYNHLAWFNLGHAIAYQGDYTEAADAIEYSFIINPSFEAGYMDCADIYCQIKKYDKALAIYEEAESVFGIDPDLLTKIADCQLNLGRIAQAKHNLYKAVRIEPHSDEIYFLLGDCYSKLGEWYSAINAYHKAIEIEDGSEDYYLGLARAYMAVEEYNKATINFQLAVSIGPEQTMYWKEFSAFLIKMGLFDEAILVLDEAEDYTFGADLLYIRALANYFNKEKEECLAVLQEALLEDYDMHTLIYTLAPELELDAEIRSMIQYFQGE